MNSLWLGTKRSAPWGLAVAALIIGGWSLILHAGPSVGAASNGIVMSNENLTGVAGDQERPPKTRALEWMPIGLEGTWIISLDQAGSVLFAGTEDGIFHKDLTSDADWTRLGLAGIRVSDIYIDLMTSGTMYCAIDILDFPGDLPTVSVYKTTDGGTTWNPADNGLPTERINTIEGRPDNPRVLYATVAVDASSTSTPLFRSEDGGASWTAIPGLTGKLTTVAISQSDPTVLYANGNPDRERFSILKSEDSGQTWGTILEGGHDWEGPISRALAIHPTDPDVVYVGAGANMYDTRDGGSTFHKQRLIYASVHNSLNAICIDSNHPDMVYAAGHDDSLSIIFQSRNAGNTWMGIPGPDDGRAIVSSMLLDRNDGGTLFVGTGNGVFKAELPESHNSVDSRVWTSFGND